MKTAKLKAPEKKYETLFFRMPVSLKKSLDNEAKKDGRTTSNLLRFILIKGLEERGIFFDEAEK